MTLARNSDLLGVCLTLNAKAPLAIQKAEDNPHVGWPLMSCSRRVHIAGLPAT